MNESVRRLFIGTFIFIRLLPIYGQSEKFDSNDEMVTILSTIHKQRNVPLNPFWPRAMVKFCDSILAIDTSQKAFLDATYSKARALIHDGSEKEAIPLLNKLLATYDSTTKSHTYILEQLAIAYLRLGERENCIANHNAKSCIMPIRDEGIHANKFGSEMAILNFKKLLQINPENYSAIWALNIAYMTLGQYPSLVPKQWLIPDLEKNDSLHTLKAFKDASQAIGFNYRDNCGGLIVDDFNNDGYLDIVTSSWNLTESMHYLVNDKQGGFIDYSKASNLESFTGGLNLIHADYDNDGYNDILVLRGGWMHGHGHVPNSLLHNNGDNTFTDLTKASGIYTEHPTQTAVWRDFNNDGWLDLFIGNESSEKFNPTELFISNRNGTFTNQTRAANCQIGGYIKGVNAGDINNDGLEDLIISSFNGRILLQNMGMDDNNIPQFKDISVQSGISADNKLATFNTWFWDYDNDGWQDIFVAGYDYQDKNSAYFLAQEALTRKTAQNAPLLYHNNQDGTFTNMSNNARLNKSIYPMGANFGDIDNDGYLDMYLGTGDPQFSSLSPSVLYRNMQNGTFADVTVSANVGNLQKGHGVVIIDIDNDGDSDLIEQMGGAYPGDKFTNSLYLNPRQNNNNWINIEIEGKTSNKSGIGTRIKVTFLENDSLRSVYRVVNSGGSFGSSAFRSEIGIGSAKIIKTIEITWSNSSEKQVLKNIKPNQFIKVKENSKKIQYLKLRSTPFEQKNTSTTCH